MPISAKIICDSIGPNGIRLTTFELEYPRFIHSELMTHRSMSRNAASSRAIPIATMLARIEADPASPVFWAANRPGMQASAEIEDIPAARAVWAQACAEAVASSRRLAALGVHKGVANRVTEPFQHMVTLVTATDYANFFHLRYHQDAQQEFQALAKMMYDLYTDPPNAPTRLSPDDWHLPYITQADVTDARAQADKAVGLLDRNDYVTYILRKVSVGRCARTSYVNQSGKRSLEDDISLHDRLISSPESGEPGHWSPFEHVAQGTWSTAYSGNFRGWIQYRKQFPNENTTKLPALRTT